MSIARCDSCERLIDTDDDPDCFIDTSPTTTVCRCVACRDADARERQQHQRCLHCGVYADECRCDGGMD